MCAVLSIAGSDPGGGAGIQQDLKVFTVLGAFGCAVVTALTAQNTLGVQGILPVEPGFFETQLRSLMEDISFAGIKVGMLANASIVKSVARTLSDLKGDAILVIDPVMVSKNGKALLDEAGIDEAVRGLFPAAHVLTPNIPEAERLLGRRIVDTDTMEAAARDLLGFISCEKEPSGRRGVILKGGHLEGNTPVDVLACDDGVFHLAGDRLDTPHTHGTGCTFSSALTVFLAAGDPLPEAARKAKALVTEAIRRASPLGKGIGPVNPAALITPWETP